MKKLSIYIWEQGGASEGVCIAVSEKKSILIYIWDTEEVEVPINNKTVLPVAEGSEVYSIAVVGYALNGGEEEIRRRAEKAEEICREFTVEGVKTMAEEIEEDENLLLLYYLFLDCFEESGLRELSREKLLRALKLGELKHVFDEETGILLFRRDDLQGVGKAVRENIENLLK